MFKVIKKFKLSNIKSYNDILLSIIIIFSLLFIIYYTYEYFMDINKYEHLENKQDETKTPEPQTPAQTLDELNTKITAITTSLPLVQSNITNLNTNFETLSTNTTALITLINKIKSSFPS